MPALGEAPRRHKRLGHTSSQITLGIYAHLLNREEQARRTREMLQEMLGGIV
jgi:integrase